MTPQEYTKVREENPHLNLPLWAWLTNDMIALAVIITPEELIARRAAVILGRDWWVSDKLNSSYVAIPDLYNLWGK